MHPKIDRRCGNTGGFAMFIVLIIVLTLCVLLGVMISGSTQQVYVTRKLAKRSQAQTIAETGVANTYKLLVANFDACAATSRLPACAFADGTYSGRVTRIDTNNVTITSVGTVGDQAVSVQADVTRYRPGADVYSNWDANPFNTMVVAGKDASWKADKKGAGDIDVNLFSMHANKKLKIEGNDADVTASQLTASDKIEFKKKATVTADIRAPHISIDGSVTYSGNEQVGAVPKIQIPKIDLTPYYNEALKNGQVINGDFKIAKNQTVNINPPGGILWVNGSVHIDGSGTINGMIVATRDIVIKGTVTQTPYGDYPALVSRDKNIRIEGSGTYKGLIYAPKGDVQIKKKGTGSITGGVIAGRNFRGEGAWSFLSYSNSVPRYPDGSKGYESSTVVYVSAWEK